MARFSRTYTGQAHYAPVAQSRVQRNAFDASLDEAIESGYSDKLLVVFENISRFNGSCKPNAVFKWHPERKCGMVHALKTIKRGQEIYLNYISPLEDTLKIRQRRPEMLHTRWGFWWGFWCGCSLCNIGSAATKVQDDLREKAWEEWKYLLNLPWPSEVTHNDETHFASLTRPDGHRDITIDAGASVTIRCGSGRNSERPQSYTKSTGEPTPTTRVSAINSRLSKFTTLNCK
jgi:hypothetical protein